MTNLEIVLTNLKITLEMLTIPLTILEIGLQCFDIVYHSYDNFRNGSENLTETLNKQAGAASKAYLYIVLFVFVGVRFNMVCLRTVGELRMVLAFEFVTFHDVSFRFTYVRCMLRYMMLSSTQQV